MRACHHFQPPTSRQAQHHAADDADGIAAQPVADPFALFVFVEQFVYRHVKAAMMPSRDLAQC